MMKHFDEIAQWLISIPNNKINISVENDYTFRLACEYGYLEIAQWLLSIPNNKININALYDSAFRKACSNGQASLEVA